MHNTNMSIDGWDEIRTAFHVARLGTVSGAAEVLGVHHATVIRHIDALEQRLGTKLFQRHARGYTATEAGQDLLQVAQTTNDQFTQLAGRLKGRGDTVSGELVITSLAAIAPMLAPLIAGFQQGHPDVITRYVTDDRVFRLEYGEAHVAVRAGAAPDQPDNVVQRFITERYALFASHDYVERHGYPDLDGDLGAHRFVGHDDAAIRAPFSQWMRKTVANSQIVFQSGDVRALKYAIIAGAGLGFIAQWEGALHPELVQVSPTRPDWEVPVWLVTHVDLHRTAKVQSLLKFLKSEAAVWLRQRDAADQETAAGQSSVG